MATSMLRGRSVLVAHEDSFIARYVECGLRGAGADVLGPARGADELMSLLETSAVSACVISDTYASAAYALLGLRRGLNPAFLLIGHDQPAAGFSVSALCYPFGTYQVSDAVSDLLRGTPLPLPAATPPQHEAR